MGKPWLVWLVVLLGAAAAAAGEGWPQFLGPRRDGICCEPGLNADWSARPPAVRWRVALGGGFSSLSFAGQRLFTMHQRGKRDFVVCLDADNGRELWAFDAADSYLDKQRHGWGPRATPTWQAGKLYCLLPRGELYCLSADDGAMLWKVHVLQATAAPDRSDETYYWGMAGSPLVEGDLVVVQPGGEKNNSVAAFHKDTGKLLWTAGSDPPGYGSPIAITAHGRRIIVCTTGQSILGLDAAGRTLWRYPFGNKYNCNCATPLWVDDVLFVSAAYGTGCAALTLHFDGQNWTVREKWRNKNLQNQFATSAIVAGHVYGCHGDLGAVMLRCLDFHTGEEKWSDRRPGKCSLLAYGDRLVCTSESGTLRLLEANPREYVVKGEITGLLTRRTWPPPAIHQGLLYVRDEKNLFCFDLRQ
jgi:outer membrane protein assembly factor BamB